MRKYERRERTAADRVLQDLHDDRDHLNIEISLFKDREQVDLPVLAAMQRKLALLDSRITGHVSLAGAHNVERTGV